MQEKAGLKEPKPRRETVVELVDWLIAVGIVE